MTPGRVQLWSLMFVFAGTTFGVAHLRPSGRQPHNLDSYTEDRLSKDLMAELDDVFEGHDPDEAVEASELDEEIMDALSDENDDSDESDIDLEDLQAEMAEAGTTLDDVVEGAIKAVDRASAPSERSAMVVLVSRPSAHSEYRTTRRLAVASVDKRIIQAVYKVRR